MSATQWSGPYCHAEDVTGERLAWDPLANGRAPRPAVRYVVRWRVSGFANPRKRTFPDAGAGKDFAARIAAAKVLAAPCDARGWPMLAAPERPSAPSSPTESPAEPDGLQFDEPRVPAPDGLALVEPAPVGPRSADTRVGRADAPGSEPIVSGHAGPGRGGPGGGGPGGDGLGPSVKQYLDELTRAYRPYWEQTNQARWWLDQLAFVDFALRYEAGDERLARFGLQAGESLHFSLLSERDFNHALDLRRTTNLRVAHHNRQRQQRYERLLGEYETKLAAWQARSGRKGRRPAPPPPPGAEPEFSRDEVLISANAENRFRTAMSFVFDRAFDAGLFPAGPNPYRQWNPRGSGGRQAARRSPFRKVKRHTAEARDYPGLGFFVDLGDAMARRGAPVAPGVRTGERYRIFPLTVVQLAPRPGETRLLRDEDCRAETGETRIAPEPGGHLKQREPGVSRPVPMSALVGELIEQHVASGLAGPDGTLFLSPYGSELDLTNLTEDFLRPSIGELCGPDGLWPAYPGLERPTLYDLRKAGITSWIVAGADTLEASRWSGHDETELLRSYRGVINGRGRRRTWAGMDAAVEQALLDDPPRGDGRLAVHIRTWLGL